jgi:integrase
MQPSFFRSIMGLCCGLLVKAKCLLMPLTVREPISVGDFSYRSLLCIFGLQYRLVSANPCRPHTMEESEMAQREKQGWLVKVKRKSGPVWEYRNNVERADGSIAMTKEMVGSLAEFPTRDEMWNSKKMLKARLRQQSTGAACGKKMKMSELVERYKATRLVVGAVVGTKVKPTKRAPSSVNRIACYIDKWILPRWGDRIIFDISTEEIQNWHDSLRGTCEECERGTVEERSKCSAKNSELHSELAPATRSKICQIMGNMYNFAISKAWFGRTDDGSIVQWNPVSGPLRFTGIQRSSEPQKLPTIFEAKKLYELHQALDIRERAMVSVAMGTALRRSEMQGLKWDDIDFDKLTVTISRGVVDGEVWETKTVHSKRVLTMEQGTADDLLAWHKQSLFNHPQDFVFAGESGDKPLWLSRVLQHKIRKVAKRLGITVTGWHSFRHTWGTLANAAGVDIKVIQQQMGHSNPEFTRKMYVQALPEKQQEATAKVMQWILESGKSELIQ